MLKEWEFLIDFDMRIQLVFIGRVFNCLAVLKFAKSIFHFVYIYWNFSIEYIGTFRSSTKKEGGEVLIGDIGLHNSIVSPEQRFSQALTSRCTFKIKMNSIRSSTQKKEGKVLIGNIVLHNSILSPEQRFSQVLALRYTFKIKINSRPLKF